MARFADSQQTPKKYYNGVDPIGLGEIVWVADIDNLRTAQGRVVNVEKLSYDATGNNWAFKIDVGYETNKDGEGYIRIGEECYLELTNGIFFTEHEAKEYLHEMLNRELETYDYNYKKLDSDKKEIERRECLIKSTLKSSSYR